MLNLFKERTKSRIGLEISPEGVVLACLAMENNSVIVKSQVYKPLENSATISDTLKATLKEFNVDDLNAAISVPSSTVFIKRITLPDLPYEELKAIAPQEASKYLPLTIRELNVDFQILENTKRQDESGKKVDVILCALAKSLVKEFIDPVLDIGMGVDMIDIAPFAAIRAIAHEGLINEPNKVYISVLIGYENTDINIIQNGMPVFSYNVATGRKNLIENIMNTVHKKREEVVEMLPNVGLIVPGLEMTEDQELHIAASAAKSIYSNISGEVQKTIEFFNSGNPEPVNIEKVIVSGSGACVQNIDKYMSSRLKIETVIFNPMYSTCIGLALKGFEN